MGDKYKWPKKIDPYNLPSGFYSIRGGRKHQLCSDDGGYIVCNRTTIGDWEKFQLTNLGGGYYNIKGGRSKNFIRDSGDYKELQTSHTGPAEDMDKILITYLGNGYYSMKGSKGKYCSDRDTTPPKVICYVDSIQGWESFQIIPIPS